MYCNPFRKTLMVGGLTICYDAEHGASHVIV